MNRAVELTGVLGLLMGVSMSTPALAQTDSSLSNEQWDGGYDLKAERRSGFAASLGVGLGLAKAEGYPNAARKIDNPAFESTTGTTLGTLQTLWIGGALRDWFTVGVGMVSLDANRGEMQAQGSGFILHVEGFPLWSLGGSLRDFSIFTNLGPSSLLIDGGPERADAGLASLLHFGASFELLRLGYFAFAPTLEGLYLRSPSAEAFGSFVGLRTVFYGGP